MAAGEWILETPVEVQEIESAIGGLPDGARDALVLCQKECESVKTGRAVLV